MFFLLLYLGSYRNHLSSVVNPDPDPQRARVLDVDPEICFGSGSRTDVGNYLLEKYLENIVYVQYEVGLEHQTGTRYF
jgi:hypothetical protein